MYENECITNVEAQCVYETKHIESTFATDIERITNILRDREDEGNIIRMHQPYKSSENAIKYLTSHCSIINMDDTWLISFSTRLIKIHNFDEGPMDLKKCTQILKNSLTNEYSDYTLVFTKSVYIYPIEVIYFDRTVSVTNVFFDFREYPYVFNGTDYVKLFDDIGLEKFILKIHGAKL